MGRHHVAHGQASLEKSQYTQSLCYVAEESEVYQKSASSAVILVSVTEGRKDVVTEA